MVRRLPSRRMRRRFNINNTTPEVSLTPLIDTALTLLIIFMVTAPAMQNSFNLRLPEGKAQESTQQKQEIVISIDRDGNIFLNDIQIERKDLITQLKNILEKMPENTRVWVKIDKGNTCDLFFSVVDDIKYLAGVQDVAVAMQKSRS